VLIQQLLTTGQEGQVLWALTDNLGTVRDLAEYNAATNTTTIVNHRTFDAFGNMLSRTNPATGASAAVDCLFGFTGLAFDIASGMNITPTREYNPATGQWLSPDPSGFFLSGDSNLYRYVGNSPVNYIDPSGLGALWPDGSPIGGYVPNGGHAGPTGSASGSTVTLSGWEAVKWLHYNRNMFNNTPRNMADAIKQHWIKLSDDESKYHRFGCGNASNVKMVSPDGHSEAVFHPDGTIVLDQTNGGTYNFQFKPGGGIFGNGWHIILVSVAEASRPIVARSGLYKKDASLSLWQHRLAKRQGEQGCVRRWKLCCVLNPVTKDCRRSFVSIVSDTGPSVKCSTPIARFLPPYTRTC
jgi:RHS repeat-associated protein